jgi:outer membrane protein
MVKKITLLILPFLALATITFGQSAPWTLEQCVSYARKNSLTVKRALNAVELAQVNDLGNRMQRLPSLNSSANGFYQFGRTINPATNSFVAESIGTSSFSVNGGVVLYNGGIISNSIKQGRIDLQAANLDAMAAANDISLQVAAAYLDILLAAEQLANAEKQLDQSSRQLQQTDKLINAGSLPVNDRLDFVAQVALNQQAIIEANNLVKLNTLILKQLLELDPAQEFAIVRPTISIPADAAPESFQLEEVYTAALGTQPQIEAGELRINSAALDEKIARGNIYPRLTLGGSLNTNFSNRFQDFSSPINPRVVYGNPQEVIVNGEIVNVQFPNLTNDGYPDIPFGDQLSQNFGQSIGLSLNIPIYNNHINRVNIERARINTQNAQLTNQQTKQTLKADVQRSIAAAQAARESYEASLRSVEAAQGAFDNAQKRFDLGAINTLEYATATNNLDLSQLTLIQAKYQYLFNLKVVDFYLGREITLD